MATPVELRHLCLLLSAGSLVYRVRGALLPASVRCALYLLLAFALRRGNLGRDLLRGTTYHFHGYPSTPQRHPTSFLAHRTPTALRATPLMPKIGKHGSPHLSCI
jgi:hypothetical protein